MRPRRAVSAVSRRPVEAKEPEDDQEHPLLGIPRRDTVVTAVLAAATVTFFALMATDAGRRLIQPIDDAFLRWVVSHPDRMADGGRPSLQRDRADLRDEHRYGSGSPDG